MPLAGHFLRREAERKKKQFKSLAADTIGVLRSYSWPGNVRELENTIERAVLMHDGELLLPRHISFLSQGIGPAFLPQPAEAGIGEDTLAVSPFAAGPLLSSPAQGNSGARFDCSIPGSIVLPEDPIRLDDLVDAIMNAALERFGGNKTKAADFLGISRFALHRRLQAKNDH